MSWNIKTPGDYINGPLTVTGSTTITGDLTVDTNTLKVDSANNRVGIGTASPAETLHVSGGNIRMSINQFLYLYYGSATNYASLGADNSGNVQVFTGLSSPANRFQIANDGVCTWSNVGGVAGTAMTLNSTGLGVGNSPSYKLHVARNADGTVGYFRRIGSTINPALTVYCNETGNTVGFGTDYAGATSPAITFTTAGIERLRIDAIGNVGIGVTPSAGGSDYYKTLELGKAGCGLFVATAPLTGSELSYFVGNAVLYYNAGNAWKYGNNGAAAIYGIEDGIHKWYNATTGTAGVDFTPTHAMTLDGSGNLLVKKTASGGTTLGVELLATGQINGATANQDNLNIYNTTAAAYRFYVNSAGTVFATNTTISAISDARFKENVQDIDVGLGAILALKPRKFDWKDGKGKNIKGDRGFIAQEFETVFPNLIDEWKENAPEGEAPYKSVRQDLIPVLVKAIQELTARVVTLENA